MRDSAPKYISAATMDVGMGAAAQGLTIAAMQRGSSGGLSMASRAMRLKLSGRLKNREGGRGEWEVSERRQVGDAEAMINEPEGSPWWRNVGMEEGL